MIVNLLLLLAALCLSSIAGYYSVIGMGTLFAAAWWPVVIMTGTLEFSKIIVASWLYRNWHHIPRLLKVYLTGAVIVLMFITSLGIFGFLSKAHIDQAAGMGDNNLLITQLDQQIQIEQTRIDDNRKIITQMDDAVNSILSQSTVASTQKANKGGTLAKQATALRNKQKADRDALNASIDESNKKIQDLNSQKLKLEQEKNKMEAEVGPIKYIAQMIYGDNPDKNLLEKAVRYVIILIILVFDPLAVLMIIAANMGWVIRSKEKAKKNQDTQIEVPLPPPSPPPSPPVTEQKMTYTEAITELAKSDDKNNIAWVDNVVHPLAFNFPIVYPKSKPINDDDTKKKDIPAKKEEQPVEETRVIEEPKLIEKEQIDEVKEEKEQIIDDTNEKIIEQIIEQIMEDTVDLTVKEITPIIQDVKTEKDAVTETTPKYLNDILQSSQEKAIIKKPDDILQTIKQYHNVRLDDAKRTLK